MKAKPYIGNAKAKTVETEPVLIKLRITKDEF